MNAAGIIKLKEPEMMDLSGPDGKIYTGGSQQWFDGRWQKLSGCGPVAASNLIWYAGRMRAQSGEDFPKYYELMSQMFSFHKPGLKGVNSAGLFTSGILQYGEKHGLVLKPESLEIFEDPGKRPDTETVCAMITSSLQNDSPVAFLNLSSGTVKTIENWHWMTIIAIEPGACLVHIADYGAVITAGISEWLETTKRGGAFVSLAG